MERPQPPTRLPHALHTRTRWSDADAHGELNNAVYLTLLEEARLAYFGELGLLADGASGRFPFVLGQCNIRFVARGRGGTGVLIETGTTHLGTSSIVQSYRVRAADTGEVWCEADALLVCVDADHRSCPMDAAFRAAVEAARAAGTG